MHGMSLRYLELGLAFGTSQDFSLFDFVFVHVDFGGTFRAADHGSILRWILRMASRGFAPARCSVLYTAQHEVNACRSHAWWESHGIADTPGGRIWEGRPKWWRCLVNIRNARSLASAASSSM